LAGDLLPGVAERQASALRQYFGMALFELAPHLGCFALERARGFRLEFLEPGPLDDVEVGAGHARIQGGTVDGNRLPHFGVLIEWRHEDRRALEHESLGRADHAIHDRTFQQLAAGSDHEPPEAPQPAALVQRPEKPLDITAVPHREVDVQPARSGQALSGVRTK
jgi:hypothetical protein